jgi:hypothetical protein
LFIDLLFVDAFDFDIIPTSDAQAGEVAHRRHQKAGHQYFGMLAVLGPTPGKKSS